MAKTKKTVMDFLNDLFDNSYEVAKEEVDDLRKFAKKTDGINNLRTWDISYYTEKLKKELLDLDEDTLRPYFKSENVVSGVFEIAKIFNKQK